MLDGTRMVSALVLVLDKPQGQARPKGQLVAIQVSSDLSVIVVNQYADGVKGFLSSRARYPNEV